MEILFKSFNEEAWSHKGRFYTIPAEVPFRSYQPRDLTVVPYELAEVEPLVPGTHRMALHEPIRVVAYQARLDECQQKALTEHEAVALVDVVPHALGPNHETLDEPDEAVEHVIDGEKRIGEDDALG